MRVSLCVSAAALIEQTRELLFYSKPLHDLLPTWLGTREKIAQLGEHSPTIINAHLPRRFVCIQGREINITFHPCIVSFAYSAFAQCPRVPGAEGKEGVGVAIHSKGIDTLKYSLGKVSKTMRRGQNSYCPIEINLNETWGCRLVVSPTVFFMAHTGQSKSPSPAKWGAQRPIVSTIVCAFAPHYTNY